MVLTKAISHHRVPSLLPFCAVNLPLDSNRVLAEHVERLSLQPAVNSQSYSSQDDAYSSTITF
jgi:hypothetical protein